MKPNVHNLQILEPGQKPGRASTQKETAEINNHIAFLPDVLETFNYEGWQSYHYDLLVISAAAEFADRRWKRPHKWSRKFYITVPVSDLAWHQKDVADSLRACLCHLTGDDWQFTFTQWQGAKPITSPQKAFPLNQSKTFVIAYSDGLDSRAVASLSGDANDALCIRVAKNRQRLKKGDQPFDQIPFKVKDHGNHESSFRTRGFQFASITAIAAHLSGLTRIVVPESGQGALGPVLIPLHNIYRDYRNHPKFFRLMEKFIKALFRYRISYEQPRLWNTKGQTLTAFLSLPTKSPDILINTRSCWQTRTVVNVDGARKHCGLCAACLLRRMSMHAANITEPGDMYVVQDLASEDLQKALTKIHVRAYRKTMIDYGIAGVRHLQLFAEMATVSDEALRPYVIELTKVVEGKEDKTLKNLRGLLMTHANEWKAFLQAQGEKSFIRNWAERRA